MPALTNWKARFCGKWRVVWYQDNPGGDGSGLGGISLSGFGSSEREPSGVGRMLAVIPPGLALLAEAGSVLWIATAGAALNRA